MLPIAVAEHRADPPNQHCQKQAARAPAPSLALAHAGLDTDKNSSSMEGTPVSHLTRQLVVSLALGLGRKTDARTACSSEEATNAGRNGETASMPRLTGEQNSLKNRIGRTEAGR